MDQDQDRPAAVTRSYEATIDDVSPGERSVVARINTDAIDRYQTVIDPMGIRLDGYRANPVVLWEHGKDPARGRAPVGRAMWIKPRKTQRDVIAKAQFARDEFSDGIFRLYQDGYLKGFSVNGLPDAGRCGPPSAAELRDRPELARCKAVYRSMELTEFSAVAIPGNAEALTLAVSRGLWLPEALRALAAPPARSESEPSPAPPPALPPLRGRTLDQVEAALMRNIRAEVGPLIRQHLRDVQDLARGRV